MTSYVWWAWKGREWVSVPGGVRSTWLRMVSKRSCVGMGGWVGGGVGVGVGMGVGVGVGGWRCGVEWSGVESTKE